MRWGGEERGQGQERRPRQTLPPTLWHLSASTASESASESAICTRVGNPHPSRQSASESAICIRVGNPHPSRPSASKSAFCIRVGILHPSRHSGLRACNADRRPGPRARGRSARRGRAGPPKPARHDDQPRKCRGPCAGHGQRVGTRPLSRRSAPGRREGPAPTRGLGSPDEPRLTLRGRARGWGSGASSAPSAGLGPDLGIGGPTGCSGGAQSQPPGGLGGGGRRPSRCGPRPAGRAQSCTLASLIPIQAGIPPSASVRARRPVPVRWGGTDGVILGPVRAPTPVARPVVPQRNRRNTQRSAPMRARARERRGTRRWAACAPSHPYRALRTRGTPRVAGVRCAPRRAVDAATRDEGERRLATASSPPLACASRRIR